MVEDSRHDNDLPLSLYMVQHERQHLEYQAMMDRLQNGAISETPSTSLSSTHQQEKEQFKVPRLDKLNRVGMNGHYLLKLT